MSERERIAAILRMHFSTEDPGSMVAIAVREAVDLDDDDWLLVADEIRDSRTEDSVNASENGLDLGADESIEVRDARRYWRLRVLGAAPYGYKGLNDALVLRFTNLDAFVDEDIAREPDRGEAELRAALSSTPLAEGRLDREMFEWVASQPVGFGDWACVDCRPDSDMLVDRFRCMVHEARARLASEPSLMDGERRVTG